MSVDLKFIEQIKEQKEGIVSEINECALRHDKLCNQLEAINTLLKNYEQPTEQTNGSETTGKESSGGNDGEQSGTISANIGGTEQEPRQHTPGKIDTSEGGLGDSDTGQEQYQSRHTGSIETSFIGIERKINRDPSKNR